MNYLNSAVFLDHTILNPLAQFTCLIPDRLVKDSDKKKLKILGFNIKRLREGKNLSLRELSYACNIDNSKIAKIEKGAVNITFTTLIQLAEALEVHPSEILNTNFD